MQEHVHHHVGVALWLVREIDRWQAPQDVLRLGEKHVGGADQQAECGRVEIPPQQAAVLAATHQGGQSLEVVSEILTDQVTANLRALVGELAQQQPRRTRIFEVVAQRRLGVGDQLLLRTVVGLLDLGQDVGRCLGGGAQYLVEQVLLGLEVMEDVGLLTPACSAMAAVLLELSGTSTAARVAAHRAV